MTTPWQDGTHQHALAAQELQTSRSSTLWAVTILGAILIPAVFAPVGTFFAFFTLSGPPSTGQIVQGSVVVAIGCAVQVPSAAAVIAGGFRHGMWAQISVTAAWLVVSAGALVLFVMMALH